LIPLDGRCWCCGAITGLLDPGMRRMAALRADSVMTCGGAAVAGIIPRWQWRVFGTGFGAAEAAFADLTPGSRCRCGR
jgi:hypothetical protein